jgi:hypothetical protein
VATTTISPTSPPTSPAATTRPTTTAPEPKLGQRQTTNLGQVIVYSVKFPVDGTDQARNIRTKGMQFAELPPRTRIQSLDYNPSGGGTPLTWRVRD